MTTAAKITIVILGVGTLGIAAYFLLRKKAVPASDLNAVSPAPVATTVPSAPDSSVNNTGSSPKGSTLLSASQPTTTPAPVYEAGFPLKLGSKGAYVVKVNLMVGAGIGTEFTQKTEDRLFQRYGIRQIDSKAQLESM